MWSSFTEQAVGMSFRAMLPAVVIFAGPAVAQPNLLRNGGFEEHRGVGTIPDGWEVEDELFDYSGWIAPRVERRIGALLPRTGRFMAGMDTEQMGVDSNGRDYETPRAAIRQTVTVTGPADGVFSIFFNDTGTSGLGYLSILRLAYTLDGTAIGDIRLPEEKPGAVEHGPGLWSRRFHRVSQNLPGTLEATGDWTRASIPVRVEAAGPVRLTVWIGIFDNQNSTEVGYWRIDDAALELLPAGTHTAPAASQPE